MGHTPEPWKWQHREIPNNEDGMWATQIFTEDGETIATLAWYPKPKEWSKEHQAFVKGTYRAENAMRIVECVNACKTLCDPINQIPKLQSANAELLEALKAAANSKELTEKEITELAEIGSQYIYLDIMDNGRISYGGVFEIIKRYEAMRQYIVTETILKYTK
jgi:hypothetical protein